MRILLVMLISVYSFSARAQLLVNMQVPAYGMMTKPQLWNMVVTNTTSGSMNLYVEMVMMDQASGQEILTGVCAPISIPSGSTVLSSQNLSPIQYTVLSGSYGVDASPEGLLPIGNFDVCYSFYRSITGDFEKIAEQCIAIVVEPLSPVQLQFPYHETEIPNGSPQFSWLPPAPIYNTTGLTYEIQIVEILSGQSADDAIQQNIPLYQQNGLTSSLLLYPANATPLELQKQYSWRVTAFNNGLYLSQSETWQFGLKDFLDADSISRSAHPFVKLKYGAESGYAIFSTAIKFDYTNSVADSIWNVRIYDLSSPQRDIIPLVFDSVALVKGQNLVEIPINESDGFQDRHFYLLELTDSRGNVYRLRFEYHRPEEIPVY